MKYLHKLSVIFLLIVSYGYSQETVFITSEAKEDKEKKSLFGEAGAFSNFAVSVPIRGNDPNYISDDNSDRPWFLPDGINLHGGFGVHTTQTIALSANAGLDGLISEKLVAAPVYASLILNPKIGDETSIYAQAGIGWAFALGRGNLSGLYQKYRLGIANGDHIGFFAEVNAYGFGIYSPNQIYSFNIGIALFNFE